MKPQRIQLKRIKGYRKPKDAVVVSRPSKWGNPHVVGVMYGEDDVLYSTNQEAVDAYAYTLTEFKRLMPSAFAEWIAPLKGKDLACWCPMSDKQGNPVLCHADILLKYANEKDENG